MNISDIYKIFEKSNGIETDTRKIKNGCLFFCLRGEHFNANTFAQQAMDSGALAVIIDDDKYRDIEGSIWVENSLKCLQDLANYHRKQFNIPVIGITGTNGKTTTKELVSTVLSKKYKTHATQGNFNNHIGVPLTLLAMPKDTEIAVIEMGANHPNEIGFLCHIAEPNYGVITNIGRAHLEGFGGFEGVKKTKKELYDFLLKNNGKAFVNQQDELLMTLSSENQRALYNEDKVVRNLKSNPYISFEYQSKEITTKLLGLYNLTNVLAAIGIGRYFEVPMQEIGSALSDYTAKNKRSQWMKTASNQLYIDAYNANPSSMENAIESFRILEANQKYLILGDMKELGSESLSEHQKLLKNVAENDWKVLLVGPEICKANTAYNFPCFQNTEALILFLEQNPIKDHFILIKGSRAIHLEDIIPCL